MAPSTTRTSQIEAFVKRVIKENELPATVWITTDRREALKDADYVIVTFQVGGVERLRGRLQDSAEVRRGPVHRRHAGAGRRLPRPAQHPRPARHGPRHGGAVPGRDHAQVRQPDGGELLGARQRQVSFVGLCHGVQTTIELIAGYVDVPKSEIDYICAGINHMDWFLTLEHKGEDLYPLLRSALRAARVLQEREGARRGLPPLRLLHDRDHRPPGRVRALVPQEPEGAGPLLRRAGLRRRERRLLQLVRHVGEEVRGQETSWTGSPRSCGRAASSTARTSSRRWRRAAVQVHGQRAQRRLHRQPAGRLLRRGARSSWTAPACTRRSWASCRRSAPRCA